MHTLLRGKLTVSLGVPQDSCMVCPPVGHLQHMLNSKEGRALRRLLQQTCPELTVKDVFWTWVAREKLGGWLHTTECRPRPGLGSATLPCLEPVTCSLSSAAWMERALILTHATLHRLMLSPEVAVLSPLDRAWRNVVARHLGTKGLTQVTYALI